MLYVDYLNSYFDYHQASTLPYLLCNMVAKNQYIEPLYSSENSAEELTLNEP